MNAIYCGPPPVPHELWLRWNLDPILIGVLLTATFTLRRSPGGLAGIAVLAVAFLSPLCALSSALFSARVVHHVLVVAVAAPLLAPAIAVRPSGPALPFAAATAVLWLWHLPAAYDLALSHVGAYWAMQASLLATALWFWRAVLTPDRPPFEAMLFIVAGFAQMGLLGALLTFAPAPLYAAHASAPYDWGLAPLADQRLGGLLMWLPAGLPYAIAAVLLSRRAWSRLGGVA